MREQYPFFRDADERTLAVIGEEAADSDLKGVYQKPYAILSDKRLYCKNEQGNFIADGKSARFQGREKAQRPWMVLVSALLLFSILLTFFANGSALGLLTFRTQRAAGEAAKLAALQQEVYRLQGQLAIPEEDMASLTPYLDTYSAQELKQIYDDCGLGDLPDDGVSAWATLTNAESLLPVTVEESGELTYEQQVMQLALLAKKFEMDEVLAEFFSQTFYSGYGYYGYYYQADDGNYYFNGLNFSAESKALFTRFCDAAQTAGGVRAYMDAAFQYNIDDSHPYASVSRSFNEYLNYLAYEGGEGSAIPGDRELAGKFFWGSDEPTEEDRLELRIQYHLFRAFGDFDFRALTPEQEAMAQKVRTYLQCSSAIVRENDWSDRWFWMWGPIQNYYGENWSGNAVAMLATAYFHNAREGATPDDLLSMLTLTAELGMSPQDAIWEAGLNNAQETAAPASTLSDEALANITAYSQTDRGNLLLPLAQVGKEAIEPLARYAEKSEELTQFRNSMSDTARQMVDVQFYGPGTGGGNSDMGGPNFQSDKSYYEAYYAQRAERWGFSGQLGRAAFFATLCAWAALIGGIALLVLFALNLGKLAGLAGVGAGAVCVLCSVLGDPWRVSVYSRLPSMLIKWLPAVLGLAVAALCVLAILRLVQKEVAPTFRLITSAGTFTFREKDYSKQEREAFAAALARGEGEA